MSQIAVVTNGLPVITTSKAVLKNIDAFVHNVYSCIKKTKAVINTT